MKKTYIIRKVAYGYDDQSYYTTGLGSIMGEVYQDYETAYKNLLELEKEAYSMYQMYGLRVFRPFSGIELLEPTENNLKLKHLLEELLGLEPFEVLESGLLLPNNEFCLPENITIEQVDCIRTLSGFKFYEIVVFDHPKPQFYGIWQRKPFWKRTGFQKMSEGEDESIIFYTTYDEALAAATDDLSEIHGITIKKSLETLSDMPIVLKAMIDHSKNMDYNETTKILTLHRINSNEWVQFCSLLKKKPFEIKPMPFEIAKSAEHWVFEIGGYM